jgi:hypothetical protein
MKKESMVVVVVVVADLVGESKDFVYYYIHSL